MGKKEANSMNLHFTLTTTCTYKIHNKKGYESFDKHGKIPFESDKGKPLPGFN